MTRTVIIISFVVAIVSFTANNASAKDQACNKQCLIQKLAQVEQTRDPLFRQARSTRDRWMKTKDARDYRAHKWAMHRFMVAQGQVDSVRIAMRDLGRAEMLATARAVRPQPTKAAPKVVRRVAKAQPRLQRLVLHIADIHDEPAAPSVGVEATRQLTALRNLAGSPDAKPAPVEEPSMSKAQRRALNLGICALRAQAIWEKSAVAMDNEASGAPGGHIARSVVMHAVVDEVYYCDVESGDLNLGIGYPLYHAKDLGVLYECRVTPTRSCGNRKDWKGFPFYSSDASAPEFRGDYDDGRDIRAPRLVRSE